MLDRRERRVDTESNKNFLLCAAGEQPEEEHQGNRGTIEARQPEHVGQLLLIDEPQHKCGDTEGNADDKEVEGL